jgi:hypothetical protein
MKTDDLNEQDVPLGSDDENMDQKWNVGGSIVAISEPPAKTRCNIVKVS